MVARQVFGILCLAAALSLAQNSSGTTYGLKDQYKGLDFFNSTLWKFETFDDPTHGRVNYVNESTAQSSGLAYASVSGDIQKFIMRADSDHQVSPDARGRDSVRITSMKGYSDTLMILDLQHMPEGCATWPAWWTLSKDGPWPNGGEIDIIEGVNTNDRNQASLHTMSNCTMPAQRGQTGQATSTDCDASKNNNQGCGVSFAKSTSYGTGFNNNGGGWYVMQKSKEGVKIWFWARDDNNVPYGVKHCDGSDLDPAWGDPDAYFPMDNCDYDSHMNDHCMVFDLTFCGDWAGNAFQASGCGPSCSSYVDNNPEQFQKAYWEINSLSVYTKN